VHCVYHNWLFYTGPGVHIFWWFLRHLLIRPGGSAKAPCLFIIRRLYHSPSYRSKHIKVLPAESSYVVHKNIGLLHSEGSCWELLDQMWIEDVLDRNRRQREGPQIHLGQEENSPYANVLPYRSMSYQFSPYSVLSTVYV